MHKKGLCLVGVASYLVESQWDSGIHVVSETTHSTI